jgi:hypothetical protein
MDPNPPLPCKRKATEYGNIPWYSEACSSTLATTYSSGSGGEKQIVRRTCLNDSRIFCNVYHNLLIFQKIQGN